MLRSISSLVLYFFLGFFQNLAFAGSCNNDQWFSDKYQKCFQKESACSQYNNTDDSTCNSPKDNIKCDWNKNNKSCFAPSSGQSKCTSTQWYADRSDRCFEKRGSCSQYNNTDSNVCNSSKDELKCDWKDSDKTCYASGSGSGSGTTTPSVPSVWVENSDEYLANAVVFDAPANASLSYVWQIFSNGAPGDVLKTKGQSVALQQLYKYSGQKLGVSVMINGSVYSSKNQITIPTLSTSNYGKQTIDANMGTSLLGVPLIRRLNFSFETYVPGCTTKTIISINKVGKETNCDFRTKPAQFSVAELEVLRAAVVSVFASLMSEQQNSTTRRTEKVALACAVNSNIISHGDFVLASGQNLAYVSDNAYKVLANQLKKWAVTGPKLEDFNIHMMINDAEKPAFVLGHATVGRVYADYSHEKFQNTDPNRFEIHVGRAFLPANVNASSQVPVTYKGSTFNVNVDIKSLAKTIAHEMAHQMGLTHTQDATGNDYQDDFVYSLGQCVESNFVPQYTWNNVAAF